MPALSAPTPALSVSTEAAPTETDRGIDPGFNPSLQHFLNSKLPGPGESVSVSVSEDEALDLNALLQGSGAYFFEYRGSTTSPPCSETVTWLVRRDTVMASYAQVNALSAAVYATTNGFGNYRVAMPLGFRKLRVAIGSLQDSPRPTLDLSLLPGALLKHMPCAPSREAMATANAALATARDARENAHELERRLGTTFAPSALATVTTEAPQIAPAAIKALAATLDDVAKSTLADATRALSDAAKQAASTSAVSAASDAMRSVMRSLMQLKVTSASAWLS